MLSSPTSFFFVVDIFRGSPSIASGNSGGKILRTDRILSFFPWSLFVLERARVRESARLQPRTLSFLSPQRDVSRLSLLLEMTEKPAPKNALQAGGHGGKLSMLFEGPRLLKPALYPKEAAWYEALNRGELPAALTEHALVPRFLGYEQRNGIRYLVLENLVHGYLQYAHLFLCVCTA